MNWVSRLFSRRRLYGDLSAEIEEHLSEKIDELVAGGMSREEATETARREFGNVTLLEERSREVWQWPAMEGFFFDVRFALRVLRKSPGFTAVAVLTLALGIGANTALFSVVNGVLLNPLPYPHPEQLVTLHASKPNFATGSISYPNFRDWQKQNHTFSAMAITRGTSFSLTGRGEAERAQAEFISSDFFKVLGVQPLMGRTFSPGEDEIGGAPIVLISEGFWKQKFGSAPGVIGQSINLDGKTYTIVGVIPAEFDLLTRTFRASQIYVPIGQWANPWLDHRTAGLGIHGIGRLKPGLTLAQARADMDAITAGLAAAYPDVNKGTGATLVRIDDDMVGDVRFFLLVLLGAVGFVLLIACVNVANLLLARSTARSREFAIRAALGAGYRRLVRQLLTESLLLAFFGASLGLLVARWSTRAALGLLPSALPRAAGIRLDSRVLLFTIAISLFAGILFGLAPALKIARSNLQDRLKEGGHGTSASRQGMQTTLVLVEVAMTLVLLVGAGLMIRSLSALWRVDPGFRADNVLTFGLTLPTSLFHANADTIRAALHQADEAMESVPGVEAASLSWGAFPMSGDDEDLFWFAGQPKPTSEST